MGDRSLFSFLCENLTTEYDIKPISFMIGLKGTLSFQVQ